MWKSFQAGQQEQLLGCHFPTPSHLTFASEAIPEPDVYLHQLPPGVLLGEVLKHWEQHSS